MPTLHIVITKQIPSFRGKPERWSNGYTLQSTGANDGPFIKSIADALVAMERPFHTPPISFPYRVGGLLGEDALYAEEVTSPPNGTLSLSGVGVHPESCVLVKSKIGPKRYAFKYYHGACGQGGVMTDALGGQAATIESNVVKLTNGTLPGGAVYCRPNGAILTAPFLCDPYIRTHQLKRRGKRSA
jgi:hypothetical protein